MARKPRGSVVVPGLPVHVILRGNNGRRLFSYPREYRRFLAFVASAVAKTGCRVHGLALMTNHVHLVVTAPSVPALSRFVQHIAQRYAQARNARRGLTGKLFDRRFKAIPIETVAQLALTLAYVDLNPVRAGIADHAADHVWSTYRLHAGMSGVELAVARSWTPHEWYLALGADDAARARAYRAWVESRLADDLEALAEEARDDDGEGLPAPRIERPDETSAR